MISARFHIPNEAAQNEQNAVFAALSMQKMRTIQCMFCGIFNGGYANISNGKYVLLPHMAPRI